MSKVPTPIIDKNGKATTVHKNPEGAKVSNRLTDITMATPGYAAPERDISVVDEGSGWKLFKLSANGMGSALSLTDDELTALSSVINEHYRNGGTPPENPTAVGTRYVELAYSDNPLREYELRVGSEGMRSILEITGDELGRIHEHFNK